MVLNEARRSPWEFQKLLQCNIYRFVLFRSCKIKPAVQARHDLGTPRTPARSRQNLPFSFFHSRRGAIFSVVSQCSTSLPPATLKRSK